MKNLLLQFEGMASQFDLLASRVNDTNLNHMFGNIARDLRQIISYINHIPPEARDARTGEWKLN